MSETEKAIKQLDIAGIEIDRDGTLDGSIHWSDEDTAALRHLIAEARRCERVRVWKDSDASAIYEWPEVGAYERAQYDVAAILSAPDAETKEESR